jgi:hypothetical protein
MNPLFTRIEDFYTCLHRGDYDHPFDLAVALEALSNSAWDEVDELYQPSLIP